MSVKNQNIVYGIHPLNQALKASQRKCYKIVVEKEKSNPRIQSILQTARAASIMIETLSRSAFSGKYQDYSHQGIVGYFSSKEIMNLNDLVQQAFRQTPQPTLAVLDGIQDPQNLGAVIRSAEALGIHGIVLPRRRTAPLNETVTKCSSGALETIPIAMAVNLANALKLLKKHGFWVVGVDTNGQKPCYRLAFDSPTALLIGSEGKGIRPLLKKACDFTVSIPMKGKVGSLNVSAASAVLFYEISRQKRMVE